MPTKTSPKQPPESLTFFSSVVGENVTVDAARIELGKEDMKRLYRLVERAAELKDEFELLQEVALAEPKIEFLELGWEEWDNLDREGVIGDGDALVDSERLKDVAVEDVDLVEAPSLIVTHTGVLWSARAGDIEIQTRFLERPRVLGGWLRLEDDPEQRAELAERLADDSLCVLAGLIAAGEVVEVPRNVAERLLDSEDEHHRRAGFAALENVTEPGARTPQRGGAPEGPRP